MVPLPWQGYKARSRDCVGEAVPGEGDVGVGQKFCDCDRRPAVSFTPVAAFLNHIFDDFDRESFCSSSGTFFISLKGSPEGSSDPEFRSSILCDVIEISG